MLPGLLNGVVPCDLFGLSPPEAKGTLLAAVQAAVVGRARSTTEPAFPRTRSSQLRPTSDEPVFPGRVDPVLSDAANELAEKVGAQWNEEFRRRLTETLLPVHRTPADPDLVTDAGG